MPRPDRTHRQDLAVDELDPVVLRQDSNLSHALIFVGGESAGSRSHWHPGRSILVPGGATTVPAAECRNHATNGRPAVTNVRFLRAAASRIVQFKPGTGVATAVAGGIRSDQRHRHG